jgi:hypothetical protein
MTVRDREWVNPKTGEKKRAWVCWYTDQHGKEHIKTFPTQKLAKAYEAKVKVEVSEGRHTADSDSITVAEAGEAWIRSAKGGVWSGRRSSVTGTIWSYTSIRILAP